MDEQTESEFDSFNGMDPAVRLKLAEALGEQGGDAAVTTLIALLDDASDDVRRAAVISLRRLRDERASVPMIAMLNDDDDVIRRSSSTWFMTLTGDQTHLVEPLCEIMLAEKSRMSTRDFAAMLLGKWGDERAVEPLHQLIRDYPKIRLRAVQSLRRMADPRSVPILAKFLDSEDIRLKKTAAKTLAAIDSPDARELLAKSHEQGGRP